MLLILSYDGSCQALSPLFDNAIAFFAIPGIRMRTIEGSCIRHLAAVIAVFRRGAIA